MIFQPFLILFGLMGVGFISGRARWIDEAQNEGLGNILVKVSFPCLLLSSMIEIDMQGRLLQDFLTMIVMSLGFFILYTVLSIIYIQITKLPKNLGSMVQLSMLTSNNGFMGLPIALAFFGEEGLMLMVANNLAMGIMVFGYGIYILKRSKRIYENVEDKSQHPFLDFLKQLLNPMMASIFIGFFIGIVGISHLIPTPLAALFSSLGSLATPLSMIYIGATLYNSSLASLFKDALAIKISLTRLGIFSLVTFPILFLMPLGSLMKQVLFLVILLPSAAVVPVISAQYGSGSKEAVNIVVLSTLFSLFFTPLGVYIGLNFL